MTISLPDPVLMRQYDVDIDAFDKLFFTSIDGARAIMRDSATAAAQAMIENSTSPYLRTWQDDHEDYTRAIVNQLVLIQDFLSDDRQSGTDEDLDTLLKPLHDALNCPSDELSQLHEGDFDCFTLGFADHSTPFSSLMLANRED